MLVRITDLKDKNHWITPLYVKCVRSDRKGHTEIIGSLSTMGGMIKTRESADSVADRISVAMPDSPAWQAATAAANLTEEQQRAAAAAAAG